MLQSLYKKLKGETKFPTATKHIVKEAFEVGGVKYFEFDTTANLPYKRGLKFLSVYDELSMKCDRYYLQKHCEAIDKILSGTVSVKEYSQILMLNNQMKERLTWVYQEDLVYKIASVVFFDANENPDDWEWEYALKKIEHWKKHEGVGTFFLHEPMQRLVPFLNASAVSVENYSQVQVAQDTTQLENLLQILSDVQKINLPTFTERIFSEEMKQSLQE